MAGATNRLTMHNGRAGKDGVYSADHNDRRFISENDEHIDPTRSHENIYASVGNQNLSFKENERNFYIEHFGKALDEQNARNIKNGHPERNKTIDSILNDPKSCPEDTLYYINSDKCDRKTLNKIMSDYVKWHKENYPQVQILNIAGHFDEAKDHFHIRRTYIGHDKNGNEVVSQNKALAEMGIQRPDLSRKEHRWNNAKMTYTKECREKLFEMCREHGIELTTEPQEHSKSGLSLEEYKYRQEHEKVVALEQNVSELTENLSFAKEELASTKEELKDAQTKLNSKHADYDKAVAKINQYNENLSKITAAENKLKTLENNIKLESNLLQLLKGEIEKLTKVKDRFFKKPPKEEITVYKGVFEELQESDNRTTSWVDHIKNIIKKDEKALAERENQLKNKENELNRRESTIKHKEAEIDPLHEQAKQELKIAESYKQEQADYITKEAETLLNDTFGSISDRSERLEEFCAGIKYSDGMTVLEDFENHEQELLKQQQQALQRALKSRYSGPTL